MDDNFEASLKVDKALKGLLQGQKMYGEQKLQMDQDMWSMNLGLEKMEGSLYKTETKMSNVKSEWSNLTKEIR
ncbi:MAG: hypothetical protein MJ246_06680 [Clostridia bacterium]|nr:hypothetical protein [Clostridia bacterium]